jgi:ATP-dependent DNA helicase HFM1/MER3
MKPDDDDNDSNIPIKDLTRPRSPLPTSSTLTQKNTKPKEKMTQSVLRPADKGQSSRIVNTSVQDTPRKRSDGKYEYAVSYYMRAQR